MLADKPHRLNERTSVPRVYVLTILPPVTALTVGLPAQRAVAPRFRALAQSGGPGMSALAPRCSGLSLRMRMRRRDSIGILGSMAAARPPAARAQQAILLAVGFLNAASPDDFAHVARAFRLGLIDMATLRIGT